MWRWGIYEQLKNYKQQGWRVESAFYYYSIQKKSQRRISKKSIVGDDQDCMTNRWKWVEGRSIIFIVGNKTILTIVSGADYMLIRDKEIIFNLSWKRPSFFHWTLLAGLLYTLSPNALKMGRSRMPHVPYPLYSWAKGDSSCQNLSLSLKRRMALPSSH